MNIEMPKSSNSSNGYLSCLHIELLDLGISMFTWIGSFYSAFIGIRMKLALIYGQTFKIIIMVRGFRDVKSQFEKNLGTG